MKRKLTGLVLFVWTLAAGAAVDIQHWDTPSGTKVFFVETHVLPIVDVQLDFAAGNAFDPAGKAGLATLTKGLLDAGAGDLDEERIAERVADSGAQFGGSVDADRAGVSLRTLSSPAERRKSVELLRLMLASPSFPQAVLEREKSRLIASIREADTHPDSIAARRFSAAVYPGHPYGVQATAESVAAIGREDLQAFHRSHYGAKGATLSIVGDLSRAEAEALATSLTDALPPAAADAPPELPEVKQPLARTERIPHPAAQSHVLVGLPGIRRGDPDYFPLLVGNYILGGGGFVSRLVKEVRDARGYAYSVYSYFLPLRGEGPFQIGLQTKRSQADAALGVARETLAQFLAKGPTEKELAAAKRNLKDGFALRLDSNRKILEYLAVIGFYGLPLDYLDTFQGKVERVTAAQIREAFARHVQPDHLVTVIVAGDGS